MTAKLYNGNSTELEAEESLIIVAITTLMERVLGNADLAAIFSQGFTLKTYMMGDAIANLSSASVENPAVQKEANPPSVYLVCHGRVRLLATDSQQEREVSVGGLEVGDSFGGDQQWCDRLLCLPYQAIAAQDCTIAEISLTELEPRLLQLPSLREEFQRSAQQRQALIFYKTLTELRRYPSHKLRILTETLDLQTIPAGATLQECCTSGRYWLRQGEISAPNTAFSVGESWGYPNPIPEGYAKTPLKVYQINGDRWDSFQGNSPSSRTPAPRSEPPRSTASPIPPPSSSQPEPLPIPQPTKQRGGSKFWQHYPLVEQQSSSDCGAACLATVGRYWGKSISLNYLRQVAEVGRSGTSLKALAKAAEQVGFQALPVRASLSRLTEQQSPWIAHWEGNHYIIVYRVKGDRLWIGDPAKGKQILSRQAFLASWTGYALLLEPTELLETAPAEKLSLGRFWRVLSPYRTLIGQIIIASILIQIFGIITPLFTQIILDQVVVSKSEAALNVFAVGMLLFGVWSACLSGVRQYLLSYFANRLDLTLIGGFIHHAMRLPLKFFELRRVGDIVTRVQENEKIQRFLIQQVVLAWLNFLTGFVYLGLMVYYNWKLALLVVAIIPPLVLLTFASTPLMRKVSREVFSESAEQNSTLVEAFSGIATIKSTASERELRWRWEERLTKQLNARFRAQKLGINLQTTGGLIFSLGTTALLWYGATLVIQDQLSIGQFVAFNMMLGQVLQPAISLTNLWDELQEVLISVERLNDVFSAEPEEVPQKPLLVLPPLRGEVKFENVTFRYSEDDEQNTLQNISFEVKPGQTIAIVGRSGSGKSTLVKLLQALYHPTQGRIFMDGHDLRHVSPPSLRSQMGVVPQECYLFSGTILENIALYRDEYRLEQVVEAAKLAEAHSFIQSLPLGYNTKVGEQGSNLSGGQRQRIAIARALLTEPRILILDEATSSLDTESERRFQRNLEQLGRDRTLFIVAHRLSTVRNADRILVLDRGLLVEQGTHTELFAAQGLYYHLAQQQLDL